MKIAVISDIHANPVALNNCYMDAKRKGCEKFVCLGDVVGYGYNPSACIKQCRDLGIDCIIGNHDSALIGSLGLDWFNEFAARGVLRQRGQVSEDDKTWLRNLKTYVIWNEDNGTTVAFAHGSLNPTDIFGYIHGPADAMLEASEMKRLGTHVLFVGHTHYAEVYLCRDIFDVDMIHIDLEDATPINLLEAPHVIVNVGSCGYPRNQPYSIYCIYDNEAMTATHQILPFGFDDYINRMNEVNAQIPFWMDAQKKLAERRPILWK